MPLDQWGEPVPRREPRRSWGAVAGGLLVVAGMFGYLQWTTDGALVNRVMGLAGFGPERAEGTYRFLSTQPGTDDPVAWRCGPIEYQVNPRGAPENWRSLVEEAADRVRAAGGPELVLIGTTGERDVDLQPDSMSQQPVLVMWSREADQPELADDVVGVASPYGVSLNGYQRYVGGTVVLEQEFFDRADTDSARGVVMHEFGHLVGLDHVDDRYQLMHAEGGLETEFGSGDRAGLRTLGELRCG